MKILISENDGVITIQADTFSYRVKLSHINYCSVVFDELFSFIAGCGVITLPDGQGGVIIKSKFMGIEERLENLFEERLENLGELNSLEGIVNYIVVVNNLLRKGSMKSACLNYRVYERDKPSKDVINSSNYD